jgi:two-component sensor histidine kinase
MKREELRRRLEQRDLLAALGAFALKTVDRSECLTETCRLVAAGLGIQFCKFLEPLPGENALLVSAGVGWREGVVGNAKLEGGAGSPAGHALKTGQPVLSTRLAEENRFKTPELLREHGIETAMNVIVRGESDVFGVLEADSRRAGVFDAEDIAFMQAAANLLGLALERGVREQKLKEAVAARETLLREADHRIKNSLQLVASLLTMQRSRLSDREASAALDEAIARVHAVAQTHRAFQRSSDLRRVPLGEMLCDISESVGRFNANVRIECEVEGDLELDSERAIPLGLIASEWLTNAVRHAYPPGHSGTVRARAVGGDAQVLVEISDDGAGMAETAAGEPPGLGTAIVRALVRQIGAKQEIESRPGGTTARLRLPRNPEPES